MQLKKILIFSNAVPLKRHVCGVMPYKQKKQELWQDEALSQGCVTRVILKRLSKTWNQDLDPTSL